MLAESPSPLSVAPPARRRFWQFSLATLLFLAVIAALAAGYYASAKRLTEAQQQLQDAQAQIADLRYQLHYLDITDPSKVHIQMLDGEFMRWHWRVYLPPTHDWELVWYAGEMRSGAEQPGAKDVQRLKLPSGEHNLSLVIQRTLPDGLRGFVEVPGVGSGVHALDTRLAEYIFHGEKNLVLCAACFTETDILDAAARLDVLEYFVRDPFAGKPGHRDDAPREDPTGTDNRFAVKAWLESRPIPNPSKARAREPIAP
jgi:hypothetical protein